MLNTVYGAQVPRAQAKEIIFDQSSRKKLQDGINKVADAVGVTLGPRGKCYFLTVDAIMAWKAQS